MDTQWSFLGNSVHKRSQGFYETCSHNFTPFSECLGTVLMEGSARDQMTLHIEMVVDCLMNRQKILLVGVSTERLSKG